MNALPILSIVAALAAALSGGCSKSQDADMPHILIKAEQGTNATLVTNGGHTFLLGRNITNAPAKSK